MKIFKGRDDLLYVFPLVFGGFVTPESQTRSILKAIIPGQLERLKIIKIRPNDYVIP